MTITAVTTIDLIETLYEWWCNPADRTKDFLSSDFLYDRGLGGLHGQDMVWWVEQKPAWYALTVIGRVANEDPGALVFEGIDGATEMKCRVSWFVQTRNGKVTRVVETSARLE